MVAFSPYFVVVAETNCLAFNTSTACHSLSVSISKRTLEIPNIRSCNGDNNNVDRKSIPHKFCCRKMSLASSIVQHKCVFMGILIDLDQNIIPHTHTNWTMYVIKSQSPSITYWQTLEQFHFNHIFVSISM